MTENNNDSDVSDKVVNNLGEISSLANSFSGRTHHGKEIKQLVKQTKMELGVPVSVTIVCDECDTFGRYETTSTEVECEFCETVQEIRELKNNSDEYNIEI